MADSEPVSSYDCSACRWFTKITFALQFMHSHISSLGGTQTCIKLTLEPATHRPIPYGDPPTAALLTMPGDAALPPDRTTRPVAPAQPITLTGGCTQTHALCAWFQQVVVHDTLEVTMGRRKEVVQHPATRCSRPSRGARRSPFIAQTPVGRAALYPRAIRVLCYPACLKPDLSAPGWLPHPQHHSPLTGERLCHTSV